jgi:hypothetical protein
MGEIQMSLDIVDRIDRSFTPNIKQMIQNNTTLLEIPGIEAKHLRILTENVFMLMEMARQCTLIINQELENELKK